LFATRRCEKPGFHSIQLNCLIDFRLSTERNCGLACGKNTLGLVSVRRPGGAAAGRRRKGGAPLRRPGLGARTWCNGATPPRVQGQNAGPETRIGQLRAEDVVPQLPRDGRARPSPEVASRSGPNSGPFFGVRLSGTTNFQG